MKRLTPIALALALALATTPAMANKTGKPEPTLSEMINGAVELVVGDIYCDRDSQEWFNALFLDGDRLSALWARYWAEIHKTNSAKLGK